MYHFARLFRAYCACARLQGSPLFAEIYTNTYAGGGTVEGGVSGVELNTATAMVTAEGLATGGAAAGASRKRSSTMGTLREFADPGLNVAFLDSYFSEVTHAPAHPSQTWG